jgi:hypothetical protein
VLSKTVTKHYICFPEDILWYFFLLLHQWNLQPFKYQKF